MIASDSFRMVEVLSRGDLEAHPVWADFHDGADSRTNYSFPAAVYHIDVDQDGVQDCPEDEVCDGLDNDQDGDIDEGMDDTDGDGVCDDIDPTDGCHPSTNGAYNFCSEECPCDEGEG